MAKLPIYQFTGGDIELMSLVDCPAVEVDFLCFRAMEKDETKTAQSFCAIKDRENLYFNEEQKIITGVAMLADTPIYRVNATFGEHFVTFPRDVVARLANDFMRHANDTNLQHDQRTFGLHIIESYLISETTKNELFANVPLGSWIVTYKVDDNDLWGRIKNGEFKGFSIEGWFDYGDKTGEMDFGTQNTNPAEIDYEKIITNIFNTDKMAKKLSSFMAKIMKTLAKFVAVQTDKGELSFEGELAVGTEVMTTDENGEMIPAPDGEYNTDDLKIKVEGGKVTEIEEKTTEPPAEPAAMAEEDVARLESTIMELASAIEAATAKIAELEVRVAALESKAGEVDPNNQFNKKDKKDKPSWQHIG